MKSVLGSHQVRYPSKDHLLVLQDLEPFPKAPKEAYVRSRGESTLSHAVGRQLLEPPYCRASRYRSVYDPAIQL